MSNLPDIYERICWYLNVSPDMRSRDDTVWVMGSLCPDAGHTIDDWNEHCSHFSVHNLISGTRFEKHSPHTMAGVYVNNVVANAIHVYARKGGFCDMTLVEYLDKVLLND